MSLKSWRFLAFLPWTVLPLFLIRYLMVWDQLPARLVSHFDMTGKPNGWMGQTVFLTFAVILLFVELTAFSWILMRMRNTMAPRLALTLFCLFYISVAVEAGVFWETLQYNLHGTPIRWGWIIAVSLATGLIPVVAVRDKVR